MMLSIGSPSDPPLFEVSAPMADPRGPDTLEGVARVYFAHRSTRVILASLIPLVAVRIWLGAWRPWDAGIALITTAAWPFFEWIFHIVIHLRPTRILGVTFDPLPSREHRLHHVDPTIVDHTLLPPRTLFLIAVASVVGFGLLLGPGLGLTAAICLHLGGLANGWTHLLTHTRYRPRSRFYRWVRRTHTLHHFKNEGYWFAFTGPFVDVLFGSHRDPTEVPTSPACTARSSARAGPSVPSEEMVSGRRRIGAEKELSDEVDQLGA
jgi:hypothetical protein